MVNTTLFDTLTSDFPRVEPQHIQALVQLHEEQATTPFIARYRPDHVGGLREIQIESILRRYQQLTALDARKAHILRAIEDSGINNEQLIQKIHETLDRWELEDIFLPFKQRNRTKATTARERGLEPLAEKLWDQADPTPPETLAQEHINPENRIETPQDAIDGAVHIMAEWIALNTTARSTVRNLIRTQGTYTSQTTPQATEKNKYETYQEFSEPLNTIPSHRLLAIRRGTKENQLTAAIELDHQLPIEKLQQQFIINTESPASHIIQRAIEHAYHKLMWKEIAAQVNAELDEHADIEAIEIFSTNLRNLLFFPAAGNVTVIGIEPSPGTPQVAVAVVDPNGTPIETAQIQPGPQDPQPEQAAETLKALIEKHSPAAIVLGNGSASCTADDFLRNFLNQAYPDKQQRKTIRTVINETGANIYSTSKVAKEELPDYTPSQRCAITIARRFQDPLAELVKIDPRAIGVGQYQHLVDQRRLRDHLRAVVLSCVNAVGADINTASYTLLSYISGINRGTARRISEHRTLNGPYTNLEALKQIPAVNDHVYQQAAGFFRCTPSDQPLDNTAVHPELYELVGKIAQDLNAETAALIGNKELLDTIQIETYVSENTGRLAIRNLIRELRNPDRDPRRKASKPHFDDAISSLHDLKEGMLLEGTVTNVTNFGAFVDIGVHQDGLVHVSELSTSYVRDPNDAVRIGQAVKVRVISVDRQRSRISLSIKQAAPRPSQQRRRKKQAKPQPGAQKPKDKAPERRPITAEDIKKLVNRLATR